MTSPPSILIYGRDSKLLETRGWVLERAGYRVVSAVSLREAGALAAAEPVKLVILCHTLSPEDCQLALQAIGDIGREVDKLFMTANTPLPSTVLPEQVVDAFGGPRILIAAAKQVLEPTIAPS